MMSYSIDDHRHRFFAWAASRAASVKNCRFEVRDGLDVIEKIGLKQHALNPELLPISQDCFDAMHEKWRSAAIEAAKKLNIQFTHGVAAKLINVYFKGMIICGEHFEHPNAFHLHPPIDRLLLDELYAKNIGNQRAVWQQARKMRWSKFGSGDYQHVVNALRASMLGEALWAIEKHWRGHQ